MSAHCRFATKHTTNSLDPSATHLLPSDDSAEHNRASSGPQSLNCNLRTSVPGHADDAESSLAGRGHCENAQCVAAQGHVREAATAHNGLHQHLESESCPRDHIARVIASCLPLLRKGVNEGDSMGLKWRTMVSSATLHAVLSLAGNACWRRHHPVFAVFLCASSLTSRMYSVHLCSPQSEFFCGTHVAASVKLGAGVHLDRADLLDVRRITSIPVCICDFCRKAGLN